MKEKEKQVIGRRELVGFPDLGLKDVEAKVDTGAYTTALHCNVIRLYEGVLYCIPLGPEYPNYKEEEVCFKEFTKRGVRNSFGDMEERYIIKTRIKIGRRIIKSFISLTDRGNMRYPVLIGRKLLRNKFTVDVSQLHLLTPKNPPNEDCSFIA